MPREPRNIGASVRARLLDRARAERSDFQILLTRYALERLLYRLSVSPHRDRFILKGAMLFVTWVADPFRPTRDLDLLGQGPNDAEAIAKTFRAIFAQPVADDGVTFDVAALTAPWPTRRTGKSRTSSHVPHELEPPVRLDHVGAAVKPAGVTAASIPIDDLSAQNDK